MIIKSLYKYFLGFVLYWAVGFIIVEQAFKLDIILLIISSLIFATWSIIQPLHLKRALIKSNSKVSIKYKMKIEEAFNNFIKDTNQIAFDRFNWLNEKRVILNQLSKSAIDKKQWLIIFLISFSYVVFSLGYIYLRTFEDKSTITESIIKFIVN